MQAKKDATDLQEKSIGMEAQSFWVDIIQHSPDSMIS